MTMPQKQKAALTVPPLPACLWGAGVIAFCAAALYAVLTARGGTLLLFWLWVLCVGGLWLMLHYTRKLAFPEESLRADKPFLLVWLAGSAAAITILAALITYRQTVYRDDSINYYAKQTLLFSTFGQDAYTGLSTLLENLRGADYKMFMNLFLTLPYYFTARTINLFMLCYAVLLYMPMWYAALLCAKRVAAWFGGRGGAVYYALCMAAMVLWPMFWYPAGHGMPDAFGLTFAAVILLLCADYRFERLEWSRLFLLSCAAFALILTRRWYLYWLVGFFALYALAVLVTAARRRALWPTLARGAGFAVVSAVIIAVAILPTVRKILTTDYGDIYGSYYGGGFWQSFQKQLTVQGWLWMLLCAAGLAAALTKRAARLPALLVTAASVLAMVLFTNTQSLGDHQSLILAPMYWGLLFCAAAWLCAVPKAAVRRVGIAVLAGYFALNFANNLGTGRVVGVTPLLANDDLDLTRRTDLDKMHAVTDFVLQNCAVGETAYLNIDEHGYSGTAFAYSDTAQSRLTGTILWESSVPSTHGFPTGIWTSRYVMVTDTTEGEIVGRINTALRTDTPAAVHYTYVTEFPLDYGITLYCYERTAPPDQAEADYFKQLFADHDARWPELFSQRIDEYMASLEN